MSSPSTSELRRAARKCCTTMRRGWAPRPGARVLLHRACVGNRDNVVRLVASTTASAPLRPPRGSKRPRAADAPSDEAHLAATPAPASAPPGHQHTAGTSPGATPPQPHHAPHARSPAFAAPRPPPPHTRAPAGPHPTITFGDSVSLSAAAADAANAAAAAARRHTVPTAHTGPVPTAGALGLPVLPAELPGGGGGGASGAGAAAAVAAAAGSHTEPANARLSAHGCYRVLGPAVIRRRGDTLVARLLPGARLELMEADGAAAAMRPAFQAPATASAGAAAAAAAASRGSVSSVSSSSSGSSGSMDGPVDLASLGLVICNSPGGGGGGGRASRDDSGLGVELPLRRCLVAAAAGDSLDGEDDNAAEMDLYGNGNGSSCGCVMVAAGATAPAVALKQQRQPRQQPRPTESSKEVWEATEAEEAPAGDVTRPRYLAAAMAGWGGAQPAPAPAPLLLPLPAACDHPPPRPCAPSHQATQQEQQAVGVGGEEGGGDAAAGWGLLTAGCEDDEDDGAVAECVLVAAHVELGGSACSVDQLDAALHPAVTRHNGRTYLAVRRLPPHAVITLHADGDLSHPVNVTPPPPPPQPQ